MTKQTELKPCPFCGGKAELFEGYRLSHVYCINCNAQTDSLKSTKRAVELWNSRLILDALDVAERKRLKAALDLILKIANAYPHDGSACAHIAERALAGDDAAEEWERLGKEIDAEAEKANVIGIWEFKR